MKYSGNSRGYEGKRMNKAARKERGKMNGHIRTNEHEKEEEEEKGLNIV